MEYLEEHNLQYNGGIQGITQAQKEQKKRQELMTCFQKVWTIANLFGRASRGSIRWNLTPPQVFLPKEFGAWIAQPIRIHHLLPSPNPNAKFTARMDLENLIDDFLQEAASTWRPPSHKGESRSPTLYWMTIASTKGWTLYTMYELMSMQEGVLFEALIYIIYIKGKGISFLVYTLKKLLEILK